MTGDLEGRLGIRAWDFGFGTNIEDLEGVKSWRLGIEC